MASLLPSSTLSEIRYGVHNRPRRRGIVWPLSDSRSRVRERCESEPSLQRPKTPTPPLQRPTLSEPPATPPTASPTEPLSTPEETGPTIEFQRRQARALREYFESLKAQEISKQPVFGFTPANEIGNGRWVMFGLLVGLLTEYATGVNFIDQLKLIVSNLGIADIYE